MYVGNVSEDGFENNPHLDRLKELAAKKTRRLWPYDAAMESEIAELEDDEKPNSSPKWAWKNRA